MIKCSTEREVDTNTNNAEICSRSRTQLNLHVAACFFKDPLVKINTIPEFFPLLYLPDLPLTKIVSYLQDPKDFCRFGQACKKTNYIMNGILKAKIFSGTRSRG